MDQHGFVSIDGEEYVPRKLCDELQEERDRLAEEVEWLRQTVAASSPEEMGPAPRRTVCDRQDERSPLGLAQ
jgi:hypothetical protein